MKNLCYIFLIILILPSCNDNLSKEDSEEDIRTEVLREYNAMYNTYALGNDEFFKFYVNDFTRLDSKGNLKKGVTNPKEEWNEYLNKYSLKLLSFDEPEMIVGSDQVVTINTYVELFIEKSNMDTTYNKGVYVAVWSKQSDDTWKISMDTWHAGLD